MGVACAAAFCALELALFLRGLIEAPAVARTMGLSITAVGVFFVVFRLGWNERAKDPSLTGAMMVVAMAILLDSMYVSPIARETFGIFIGVIMLFGVFRFPARWLLLYGAVSLLAYGAMLNLSWRHHPLQSRDMDVARWLVLATAIPLLAWIGGHVNRFRRRMHERRVFYQTIWDACKDVVVVMDTNGLVRYANPAAARVLGFGPGELVGASAAILQGPGRSHDGVASLASSAWGAGAEQGHTVTWEIVGRHRSGRVLPLEVTFSAVLLDGERMVVAFLRDITERKQAEERIHHMARHDVLTGLPNRALLIDRLDHAINDARQHGRAVSVAFIDLDRFKRVNDSLGHRAGDALLISVTARLRSVLRSEDTIARLGGDEFVLVLPHTSSASNASDIVQRVMEAVATPVTLYGHEVALTCSVGIAVFPQDGDDADALLERADIAMYRAKEEGRSDVRFYASAMNEQALERLNLERDLRIAVAKGQFVLHYQPQIELRTGAVIGMEALVRWRHPVKGLLGPADFIALAEELGLIVPLGHWVIREACTQMRAWHVRGLTNARIAVNLSPRQFADVALVSSITDILSETGLEAKHLELEITESMVMTDIDDAIGILRDLKALGVHLSIDDFGTGHSSLGYLKRFPIDALKVDRSFVRDIATDADDATIVAAMISLAHSLGLQVVAEGVEDSVQLEFLERHACDAVQGYMFSRPLEPTAAEHFLLDRVLQETEAAA